jgi:hypothetical protein
VPPIPWLALDARAGFASIGRDTTTATDLGVSSADLPARARTLVLGAHLYPFRRGKLKLGIGGEAHLGSASNQRKDTAGDPVGPEIHRRLKGISGQISLNFGTGTGWSYLTAGSGPFKFESFLDDGVPDGVGTTTLNFGGGARWFGRSHLGFTVDLRFYLTRPANPTVITAGRARERVLLFSAGISLK